MQFLVDNKEIFYQSYAHVASFDYLCSYIEIVTPYLLSKQVKVKEGELEIDMSPLSTVCQGSYYKTRLFPDKFLELKEKTFNPVRGNYTASQILSNHGLEYSLQKDSESAFWQMPKMGLRDFIKEFRDLAPISNGGGMLCTITVDGKFYGVDPVSAYQKDPVADLVGTVMTIDADYEWVYRKSGILELQSDNITEESKDTTIEVAQDWGTESGYTYATDEDYQDSVKRRHINQFYRALYTSKQIKFKSNLAVIGVLGAPVRVNSLDKYLIASSRVNSDGTSEYQLISS